MAERNKPPALLNTCGTAAGVLHAVQFEYAIYIKYTDVLEQTEEATEVMGGIGVHDESGEVKRAGFV